MSLITYVTNCPLLPFVTLDSEITQSLPCTVCEDSPMDRREPFVSYRLVSVDPDTRLATLEDVTFYSAPAPEAD